MKEKISVTEYDPKKGWTRKEYTINSKNGVFDKENSSYNNSSSSYTPETSSSYGIGDSSSDLTSIAVILMTLASLVVIAIIWVVAFRAKSNLFGLATILTFLILGWDMFVMAITGTFKFTLPSRKRKREETLKKIELIEKRRRGDKDIDDII